MGGKTDILNSENYATFYEKNPRKSMKRPKYFYLCSFYPKKALVFKSKNILLHSETHPKHISWLEIHFPKK